MDFHDFKSPTKNNDFKLWCCKILSPPPKNPFEEMKVNSIEIS